MSYPAGIALVSHVSLVAAMLAVAQYRVFFHRLCRFGLAGLLLSFTALLPALAAGWTDIASPNTARQYHTATLLPSGKLLVAGGYGASGNLASAELYDPASNTWSSAGSLATARYGHTATVLRNGRVLVTGGQNNNGYLASAELYDPVNNTWSTAAAMSASRYNHAATLLPDGTLMVTGGFGSAGFLDTTEIYTPAADTWADGGTMSARRFGHSATLLANGTLVIIGGRGPGGVINGIDLYDSASASPAWTASTGNLGTGRYDHSATLLTNGRILVAGGQGAAAVLSSAEIYNPATQTSAATGAMTSARVHHGVNLLPDGTVMASGGFNGSSFLSSYEIYTVGSATWASSGNLRVAHSAHSATLLPNGFVLAVGGYNGSAALAAGERYDPAATGTFTATGSLNTARYNHAASSLPSGQVLVTGGLAAGVQQSGAETYDASTATWTTRTAMSTARNAHTSTLLLSGKVLAVGGQSTTAVLASSELYDPATNLWAASGNLTTARQGHTATELANGKILVVGGQDSSGAYLTSAEVYDLILGTWSSAGSLAGARTGHSATLLANGKVLVAGGQGSASAWLASAELYDPASNTWSSTGALAASRAQHSATLLPNGKVLVAGGYNGTANLTSAELYDPTAATWSSAGTLNAARAQHSALLLPNGRVLLAGGYSSGTTAQTASEYYDFTIPATGTPFTATSLNTARGQASLSFLPSGLLLVAGGGNAGTATATAETFDIGLGFAAGRRPVLSGVPGAAAPGGTLALIGTGLIGDSEASTGITANSSSNVPVVQIRRLDNGYIQTVLPSSNLGFTFTNWNSQLLASGLPYGHYALTLSASGVPSQANNFSFVANLANLAISSGMLTPTFDSGITSYTASVPNATSSITLTPTLAIPSATVTVNGTAVNSGAASGGVALSVGSNAIPVVVTTQSGAQQTFTVTVTRASALSTNADLSGLLVTGVTLSPAFATATTSYTASAPNTTASVTVTPTAADANATISVNGTPVTSGTVSAAITLTPGLNTLDIIVTAQDGSQKSYTVMVTQAAAGSNNALLSALVLSNNAALVPSLSATVSNYSVDVPFATTSITVTPTTADTNATVTVNGSAVSSANTPSPISLAVGSNTITVVVTAQNLVSTRTYTLTVIRAVGSSNAALSGLTLSGGVVISPAFASSSPAGINNYSADIPNSTSSLVLTATLSDTNASFTINGNRATSGSGFVLSNLGVGGNVVALVITAQDGSSTRNYSLTVNRAPPSTGNISVGTGSSGSLTGFGTATLSSGSTLSISNGTATVGSTLLLPGAGASVSLQLTGANLVVTTAQEGTRFLLVSGNVISGGAQAVPRIQTGGVSVSTTAAFAPMLAIGSTSNANTTLIADSSGASLSARLLTSGITEATVTSGAVLIPCTSLCAGTNTRLTLFNGDRASFDTLGSLIGIAATGGGVGVPLVLSGLPSSLQVAASPVSLAGNPPRLAGQAFGPLLLAAINTLRGSSYSQDGSTAVGAIRLRSGSTQFFAVPVGEVSYFPRLTSGSTLQNGHDQVSVQGLIVELAPSLGDAVGFANALSLLDPQTRIILSATGPILATFGGQRYAALPSWTSSPGAIPGFSADSAGNLRYADATGNVQTLYPVFANFDRLRIAVSTIDSASTLQQQADGTASATLLGLPYRFRPQYLLITTPAERSDMLWWVDNGTVYLNYGDGTAQGFTIQ